MRLTCFHTAVHRWMLKSKGKYQCAAVVVGMEAVSNRHSFKFYGCLCFVSGVTSYYAAEYEAPAEW